MKTSKLPKETEVTPTSKKLKQARLPFKIISEVSPSPISSPPSRKRKLSSPDDDSVTKASKLSKENDLEVPVVISDEESNDGKTTANSNKLPNPYVKLVDAARKKKLQKSKSVTKRKRKGSRGNVENSSLDTSDTADDKTVVDCEMMEVDEPFQPDNDIPNSNKSTTQIETENTVNKPFTQTNNIVVLEDSNNSSDVAKALSSETPDVNNKTKSEDKDAELAELNKNQEDTSQVTNMDKSDVNDLVESPATSESESNKNTPEKDIKIPVTPKRSTRNKAKQEENNNSKGSPSSTKLNDSATSNVSTPKQSRSSSVTKLDDSVNESTPSNNLTPKQLQKRLESAKKREEREREKLERDKKKQQEKEERAKQRQEKEDQKKREREEKEEAKKKEKEEKEEQRKKEKEEKDKLKELEKKQKEKEKEEKDEQKRKEKEARDEEKRKKQEALEQEKQEQELKKKKTAEAFASFFVPKQKAEKDQPTVGTVSNNMLTNFTLKSDMRLAPTTRNDLTEDKANDLVKYIKEQNVTEDGLYLRKLRDGGTKPLSSGKTWPSDKDDDDVILVEDELPPLDGAGEIIPSNPTVREKLRPKLLSFHENRRPPYWGTWRKRSHLVKPRKPFGQDQKLLDYEVDSDDDWEEEQEGESIDGSAAGSDDEQGPDEYEVDNELFVPHGYLSDEEATMDEDDVLSLSPETQKAKLKHLEEEFESELKKPTEKLKPRLYGLLWENSDGGKPDNCVDAIWNYFGKLAMILDDPTPLLQPPAQEPNETEKKKVKKKKTPPTDGEQKSPKPEKKKKAKPQDKDSKPNTENKSKAQDKKNQPGINLFLTKLKST